ncbi:hypothetical protein HOY80DRAFT_1133107 [Tuber brumale]|nr:hypothetical protein HOY80DRAFT_1133107 [Tuber brumale]
MNNYTTNTNASTSRNSGTLTASDQAVVIYPQPVLKAETPIVCALERGLVGLMTEDQDMVRNAIGKLKYEMEMELEKSELQEGAEGGNTTMNANKDGQGANTPVTRTIRWVVAGVLLPNKKIDRHAYLEYPDIDAAVRRATRFSRFRTFPEPSRRSQRLLVTTQKFFQEEEAGPSAVAQVEKGKMLEVSWGQIEAGANTNTGSPILKPRPGAGVKKRSTIACPKRRRIAKAKANAEIEMEVETPNTIPAATVTPAKVTKIPQSHITTHKESGEKEVGTAISAQLENGSDVGVEINGQSAAGSPVEAGPQFPEKRAGTRRRKKAASGGSKRRRVAKPRTIIKTEKTTQNQQPDTPATTTTGTKKASKAPRARAAQLAPLSSLRRSTRVVSSKQECD